MRLKELILLTERNLSPGGGGGPTEESEIEKLVQEQVEFIEKLDDDALIILALWWEFKGSVNGGDEWVRDFPYLCKKLDIEPELEFFQYYELMEKIGIFHSTGGSEDISKYAKISVPRALENERIKKIFDRVSNDDDIWDGKDFSDWDPRKRDKGDEQLIRKQMGYIEDLKTDGLLFLSFWYEYRWSCNGGDEWKRDYEHLCELKKIKEPTDFEDFFSQVTGDYGIVEMDGGSQWLSDPGIAAIERSLDNWRLRELLFYVHNFEDKWDGEHHSQMHLRERDENKD